MTYTHMKVLRWFVPNDARDHEKVIAGRILAVAVDPYSENLELWTEACIGDGDKPLDSELRTETFRVFGTGWLIPREYIYTGTAPRTSEGYVWHLYRQRTVTEEVFGDQ